MIPSTDSTRRESLSPTSTRLSDPVWDDYNEPPTFNAISPIYFTPDPSRGPGFAGFSLPHRCLVPPTLEIPLEQGQVHDLSDIPPPLPLRRPVFEMPPPRPRRQPGEHQANESQGGSQRRPRSPSRFGNILSKVGGFVRRT